MRLCDWFDRFRDRELNPAERELFLEHLKACPGCRERSVLLDNVVYALNSVQSDMPLGFPERTARRAFTYHSAWDTQVVSLLRPAVAMVALAAVVFLVSSLWLIFGVNRIETPGEFEALVNETYSVIPGSGVSQVHTDDDLVGLLEQEGGVR